MKRLLQPSSFAGYALILNAVPVLIATHGTDATAWGQLLAAIFAIVKSEAVK